MKKLLLASTALVASASFAAAEVEVTGAAEVGIWNGGEDAHIITRSDFDGDEFVNNNNDQNNLFTDVEVIFTMTGEADNGLTFGATVELDEPGAANPDDDGGATWFLAYGNARLDMGDTDGAFDAALTEVNVAGASIADDETVHAGFNGNSGLDGDYDGQVARFSYTFDAFTGHLSIEMDDSGEYDPIYGIGVAYNAELAGLTLGVGLGYQVGDEDNADDRIAETSANIVGAIGDIASSDQPLARLLAEATHEPDEIIGLSLSTTFANGLIAAVNYSEASYGDSSTDSAVFGDLKTEQFAGIGIGYAMGALEVGVNYGKYTNRYGVEDLDSHGYGLAASYDLGGGLSAHAGYGNSSWSESRDDVDLDDLDIDTYSLGLAMSF